MLDAVTFGKLSLAIRRWGIDKAHAVLSAAAWGINPAAVPGVAPDDVPNEEHLENVARLRRVREAVQATPLREDLVVSVTYNMLRMKGITQCGGYRHHPSAYFVCPN